MYPTKFKKNKKLDYEIQIFNNPIKSSEDLEIKNIEADIYYIDRKLDTINITKNTEKKDIKDITQEWLFKGTLNIEDINDENIQEKLLFKFTIKDKLGKTYNLDRKFREFISN